MEKGTETYWEFIIPTGVILFGLLIFESQTGYIKEKIILPLKYRSLNTWLPYIKQYATKYGVDPNFVAAIMFQESGGNPQAISSVGALGLMQIMPSTGMGVCGYSPDKLKNAIYNIDCGVKYIADIYKTYRDYRYVAAGYYGGPGTAPTATKGKPPVFQYVNEVMSHYENIKKAMA